MVSRAVIFWDVDTQADFMLPHGKLYVPGAEKLLPNLNRLTDAARRGRVFLVSDACVHSPEDEEFKRFPPHCLKGTPGAAIMPETLAERFLIIPNRPGADIPADLSGLQQMVLEKQTLDVFDNPNTETVIERLRSFTDADAEFVVFGVVTEYCVRCAAKGLLKRGRRVALVSDAIETLDAAKGRKALEELLAMGARTITTEQALALAEQT
jgi:nicotinamidase/pyrazinamidase